MAVFFTSDTHFSHANIIKYCNRPYDNVHEMNIDLMIKWNEVVSKNDTVYHLGDFSFNPIMQRDFLNGNIILIRGNHDRNECIKLFENVYDCLTLQIGPYKCFLSHEPVGVGDPKFWKHDWRNKAKGCDFFLCGHIHEKWSINKRNINVGVDVNEFKPLGELELIKIMDGLV